MSWLNTHPSATMQAALDLSMDVVACFESLQPPVSYEKVVAT